MERERDSDDYEAQQERWEMAGEDIVAGQTPPETYDDWTPEPAGPPGYGFFDLRHPAACHRCRGAIPRGERVFGRLFDGRWEIEHVGCTPKA